MKIQISLAFLAITMTTSVFAQTGILSGSIQSGAMSTGLITTGTTGMTTVEAKIDGSKFNTASAQLANIDISFCDNPDKQLTMEALPNEQIPLCFQASNNGDNKISVTMKFVDGVFTNDQWKSRACQTDDRTSLFGQYVTGYETSLILEPHSVVKQMPNFQYPKSNTGMIYGCMVYYVKNIADAATGVVSFDIQIRKAKFIDMDIVTQKKADREAELLARNTKTPIDTYVYIVLGILAILLVAAKFVLGKKKNTTNIEDTNKNGTK